MRAYGRNIGWPWSDHNENGARKSAKRDKRVAFDHRDLISYSTTVARYHGSVDTNNLHVLVTARTYSISTTSHVRNCTSYVKVPLFTVPNIYYDTPADRVVNFNALWGVFTKVIDDARKSWRPDRSWHAQWVAEHWEEQALAAHQHACLYAKLVKLPGRRQPARILIDATRIERAAKLAAYNEPKAAERRLRIHARRIAKKALGIRSKPRANAS